MIFSKLKKNIIKHFAKIKSNVFVDAYNCLLCDREISLPNRFGLCEKCLQNLSLNHEHICHKCGRMQTNESDYCLTCQNLERHFDYARSCCIYEKGAKTLVQGLKFGNKKYFAPYMANLMADKFLDENMFCDIVIPVPLSPKRLKHRGYNQAEVLAQHMCNQLKLVCNINAVIKVNETQEQALKIGIDREFNIVDAYKVVDQSAIKNKNILIIDDVLTTGATASEIAKILYKAKAKGVFVLTYCSTRYKVQAERGVLL